MTKTFFILSITAAASIVCIVLPGLLEHLGEGLHLATVVVSVHHIIDEILHGFHQRKQQQLT